MRSSKSRQRSKQNRPRTLGNIINRVFDSSGPEGKVRGTPQQIIEKYLVLARDAQLSNDRVAAENFLQHAEHYTRMLAEAQREMAAEQEARRQHQGGQQGQGGGNQWRDRNGQGQSRDDRPDPDDSGSGFDLVEPETEGNLIETPEARQPQPRVPRDQGQNRQREHQPREHQQRPPREDRRPSFLRAPREETATETPAAPVAEPSAAEQPAVATPEPEAPAKKPAAPRKPRAPAKPKDKPAAAE